MEDKEQNTTEQPGEIAPTKGIKIVSIVEEMKKAYLDYSMSVIVARALPEVRDGLKPVQRRILYSMYKLRNFPDKAYKKSARIVGDVMGKYHPHGDSSIYDAMVRMAQDFSSRYMLVDGQGNFGSIDGDPAAAMRYTEARMTKISLSVISGINKDTVNYVQNYDGTTLEPEVLPSKVPNLLLNGADGIAVGMATKIPPHNLDEVVGAILNIISKGNTSENIKGERNELTEEEKANEKKGIFAVRRWGKFPEFATNMTVEELCEFVKGPDFPTAGNIYGYKDIVSMYATGRGRVISRGVAEIVEDKKGRFQIIISSVPFQVNKARLVAKIAEITKAKKLEGISEIRDESDKEGLRIAIELKKDVNPKLILNKIYKYTEMQKAFNANMLALVDGEPQILPLKKILELFVKHRQQVVIRRTEFDLAAAKSRGHILEGLNKALDQLDEVIKTIRASKTQEEAKQNLVTKFDFSEIQAQAILDMQLRRLAALERQKIEEEYKEVKATIEKLEHLLITPEDILKIISEELTEVREKFADKRLTKVYKGLPDEISEEDLVAEEDVIVTISHHGYIKRMQESAYKSQKRGGKGIIAATTKEDDFVQHLLNCNTHDQLLFFTSKGRVFEIRVHEIPEFLRHAKGIPIINLIQVDTGELITSILRKAKDKGITAEDEIQEENAPIEAPKYLFMATKKGVVKKVAISHFDNLRKSGLIAIKLDAGDDLNWAKPTTGKDDIILVSTNGKSIRFNEKDVRELGRNTRGVTGIRFKKDDDILIGMDIVRKNEDRIFVISEKGIGKMTKLAEYPVQKRGGEGVYAAKLNSKTGKLVVVRILDHPNKEMVLISKKGQIIRLNINEISTLTRYTSGVKIMSMHEGDTVAAASILDLNGTDTKDSNEDN